MYARIRRQHEWLARNRDLDGDGLLTIISPFESGMDWKASYDPVLGCPRRNTHRWMYFSQLFWNAVGVDFANFVRRYDLPRIRRRTKVLAKDAVRRSTMFTSRGPKKSVFAADHLLPLGDRRGRAAHR
jgi:hypothetical protein